MALVVPMPRTCDDPAPIASRQSLVSLSEWQARYHGGPRQHPILWIVIHMTAGGTLKSSEEWACRPNLGPKERVSWHMGVERFGQMRKFCDYDLAAYHAGGNRWPEAEPYMVRGSMNHCSLGIELANRMLKPAPEPVPLEQYLSTVWLTAVWCERFRVPVGRVVGHWEIAHHRGKWDPDSRVFDMPSFRADVLAELQKRRAAGRSWRTAA